MIKIDLDSNEVQYETIPPILAGHDVIAQGKNGSGKTAAFSLAYFNIDLRRAPQGDDATPGASMCDICV